MAPSTTPPTAAKLSSLATTTLSLILELTRSVQLSLPSPSLRQKIQTNLTQLSDGVHLLEEQERTTRRGGSGDGAEELKVLEGLGAQYERLVGLVEGLGVSVVGGLRETSGKGAKGKGKGKTGRLVDTGEEGEDEYHDDDEDESDVPLRELNSSRPPHTAISFEDSPRQERAQLDEDEATLRKANSEVVQMQQQMMDDQDETLNSLSSAISRQHTLSLHIASELELHEALLDDTDAAVDRTELGLRRAGSRLDQFTRRAKETGSTGLMVVLVVVLVLLWVVVRA